MGLVGLEQQQFKKKQQNWCSVILEASGSVHALLTKNLQYVTKHT